MKRNFLFFVLSLFAICFQTGCSDNEKVAGSEKVIDVQLGVPVQKDFKKSIRIQGVIQPVEHAVLSSLLSGTLEVLMVDEGAVVKKGDPLFQVDKQNLQNQVNLKENEIAVAVDTLTTAENDVASAEKNFKKAEIDFSRSKQLLDDHVISQDLYEQSDVRLELMRSALNKAKAILNLSKSRVEQQKTNLEIAKKYLIDSSVNAPFDGVITEKLKEQGEFVGAGTPIFEIENQSKLEFSALISSVYYDSLEVGKTKLIFYNGNSKIAEGIMTYKSSSIEPLSRTFEIKVEFPEGTKLVSGTLCDADIVLTERVGMGIPIDAAIILSGGRYIAYLNNGGKAELFEIEAGIASDGFLEVLNAEKMGNKKVVVNGQYFLSDGYTLHEWVSENN